MKFVVHPDCAYLRGMPRKELFELLDKFGWAGEYLEDTNVVKIYKRGSITVISLDSGKCVASNMILSHDAFLQVSWEPSLAAVQGTPQEIIGDPRGITYLALDDGSSLYNWEEFYCIAPFTEMLKLKSRNVHIARRFISDEVICIDSATIPLSVWKKHTARGKKNTSKLHKNLKFNCIYVDDFKDAVRRLEYSVGDIRYATDSTVEVCDTGELIELSRGRVLVYNQDIVIPIDKIYQFCGFEEIIKTL